MAYFLGYRLVPAGGGVARTHNIYPCYVMQSEYISEQGYAIYMFCNTFIEYALSGKKERNK